MEPQSIIIYRLFSCCFRTDCRYCIPRIGCHDSIAHYSCRIREQQQEQAEMDSLDAKDSGCSWWPWECCFGQKDEQGAVDPTRSTSSRSVPGFNPTAAAFVPKQVLTQRTVGGRPDAVEDPSRLYRTIEHNYMLSRLEEKPILVAALSLVVREMAGGRQICFPAPEAVDRMFVTSHGLPQDVGLLYQLIGEAYHRRGVPLDMDKVKRDFIKAHGRLMFNKTKKFKNFIVVRY